MVKIPYREPVKHPFLGARTHNTVLVLEVMTDDGCTGVSYVAIQSARQIAAIREIVLDLEAALVGKDPCANELIFDLMWKLTVDLLHDGATNIAIALIDIALWDIKGKLAGLPLWRLLGGSRRKVRTYDSDTLWRHMGPDRLQSEGADSVAKGFDAMKLRLGAQPMAQDVARVRALREAVGPDVTILTDLLWGFRPDEAIRLSR
ncbi:MAG: hypothetical protein KDJ36_19305, partial [Hyphomicrobiaceae bacterium]|nr:hypothetical protein [Hyphomicrobiaceae bacterium]